jgi:glycosyltransferase involved in cell wall biosynthesis
MAFAHLVLSQNPEDVPVAVEERICRADRIRLLGNGIDLSRYDPARVSAAQVDGARAEAGIAPDDKVVGIVARVNREKGYEEFFAAARSIAAREPRARFVVIGPVEREKANHLEPEALAREAGVLDRLAYLGTRHDMPVLYRMMDVLVLPSHREGWPRAPMEAAAMGVPTVATDIRGCRQTVRHGETGLLVPARDPRALADAVVRVLSDPVAAREMGAAARAFAVQAFDERDVVERTLHAYRDLGVAPGGAA